MKENPRNKKKRVLRKISKKRFFRKKRGQLKKRLARSGKISPAERRRYKLKSSSLRWYATRSKYHNKSLRKVEIEIPEKFCFFRDPIGTSAFFKKISKILCQTEPLHLFINHEKTKEIGLAASFMFDQMINKEKAYWAKYYVGIRLSGKISEEKRVNNFLLSFGLLKELGIDPSHFASDRVDFDYESKYLTLKMRGNRLFSYQKSVAATGLVDYFDKSFRSNGFKIKDHTKNDLINSIGEVIGNAEEHCGNTLGEWYALGCYDKDSHNCSFAIVNYGQTVYQSLSNKQSTASKVIEAISKVVYSHKSAFEKIKSLLPNHYEESIWNIMALQDGISSRRTVSGESSTRGLGIMDVLSFIQGVKRKNDGGKICLVSGYSAIVIDYEYPISNKKVNVGGRTEERRMIAFNAKKDLHYPPDSSKIMQLKYPFEGTIFAGDFVIDRKYLEQRLVNNDDKQN